MPDGGAVRENRVSAILSSLGRLSNLLNSLDNTRHILIHGDGDINTNAKKQPEERVQIKSVAQLLDNLPEVLDSLADRIVEIRDSLTNSLI